MAKTETAIHRSNRDLHVAQMGRFLFWAERNPEEAFQQAQEERDTRPWMLRALRSSEGEAAAAAIRAIYLASLVEAQAEVVASKGPAKLAAQPRLRVARQRYVEVQTALSPRRRK